MVAVNGWMRSMSQSDFKIGYWKCVWWMLTKPPMGPFLWVLFVIWILSALYIIYDFGVIKSVL